MWAIARSSTVLSWFSRALTVPTCVGRARERRPTAMVVTSLAKASSWTSLSNVIARIHRALGIRPELSGNPMSAASRRLVRPTINESVPRNLAHAAWAEAAIAPEPPPSEALVDARFCSEPSDTTQSNLPGKSLGQRSDDTCDRVSWREFADPHRRGTTPKSRLDRRSMGSRQARQQRYAESEKIVRWFGTGLDSAALWAK